MFAEGSGYSDGFVKYWSGLFANTESVVLIALAVGAVCIAIIVFTGKWKK
jgi:hypothetical protein